MRRFIETSAIVALVPLGCGTTPSGADGMDSDETGSIATSTSPANPTTATTVAGDDDSGTSTSNADNDADDDDDDDDNDDDNDSSSGDTGGPPPQTCGALQDVPSEPGPHVAQIEGLAPGSWLDLGAPAPDPQYGEARGRSWGGRALVAAPALRGAFYTGEGVHAFVKPDGLGMDDFFFYDLNAHAWIAIHPGVDTNNFNQRVADGELSIDDDGQLQDANGDPVPLHVLIHAWDFLTWDPIDQRFAFIAGDGMGRYYMPGEDAIDEGLTMLEAQREGIDVPPMSPWFYSPADCRFERDPIATSRPDVGGYSAFVYATAQEQYINAGSGGVSVFDRGSNSWTSVQDTGPRPPGYDHGATYDPVRNRLYMGSGDGSDGGGMYVYDIETSTWTRNDSGGAGPTTFRTNAASINYDAADDVVTIFHYGNGTHYTYDPVADTWASEPLPGDLLGSAGSFNAFYDPDLDAYYVYAASDSMLPGTMWVHR